MQNTFANECFIDELAAAAGMDPVEFRLAYLDPADKRGIEVLNRAAALAKWEKRASPKRGASGDLLKGRGVSYVKYELVRTYVATVAEVEVERSTGAIRVTRFYVTHDCGQIINPDGLKNQIEGNVIQTVSRTLIEDLKFNRSAVTSLDWATYPILTFPQVPEIVMELMGRGRAVRRGHPIGDFECGLRRGRYQDALGALHAGEGQGRSQPRRLREGLERVSCRKPEGRSGIFYV
jgi:CO/xanthine dehydrogenase Mo-binding subunit